MAAHVNHLLSFPKGICSFVIPCGEADSLYRNLRIAATLPAKTAAPATTITSIPRR